jgi:hypothetical protein
MVALSGTLPHCIGDMFKLVGNIWLFISATCSVM